MDVLSDVLAAVRLTGAIYLRQRLSSPPWVAETPRSLDFAARVMPGPDHVFCFHPLLEGSCWAELTTTALASDQARCAAIVIVFPKGARHTLCSTPGMRAEPDLAIYYYPRRSGTAVMS